MRWITTLRLRLRSLLRRGAVDGELDEELRYHLDRQVGAFVARGMTMEAARDAALRDMGGLARRADECRDARGLIWLDTLRQDVRYAVRGLRRNPGFTLVAIASLALGIGANTAIFAFLDAVALRPLPYPSPERIVVLRERFTGPGAAGTVNVHPFNYLQWRAQSQSFEAIALAQIFPVNIAGADGAEQVAAVQTTSDLLRVFGVAPFLGRFLMPEETGPAEPPVVVISYGLWERAFGSDPAVIGRRMLIGDRSSTIVGVMPRGFRLATFSADIYAPLPLDPANPGSVGSRSFQCYGRLKPSATLESVRAELTVIADRLARQFPLDRDAQVAVFDLHQYVNKDARPMIWVLMGVVGVVLLIACVNLAGLVLSRGVSRQGELALRASLGASRARLVRQLVVESLVLSAAGGAVGLALGAWCMRLLENLSAGALTFAGAPDVTVDLRVALFAAIVSVLSAVLFGLLPAWQASRENALGALRGKTRGDAGSHTHTRLRDVLVAAQMALAVVLLVGAGLLLRTFSNLLRVDLGFQTSHVITMSLFLGGHDTLERVTLVERMLDGVGQVNGVRFAGTIQFLPVSGSASGTGFRFDDVAEAGPPRDLPVSGSLISGDYLAAMGIPVIEGRGFRRDDRLGARRVVLVNEAFVKRYCPDGRALGRRIVVSWSFQAPTEIVGVVRDIRHDGLRAEPAPTVFLSHLQAPGYITNLVVRTTGESAALARDIRRAIQQVDPRQSVGAVRTMDEYVDASLAQPRLYAVFLAAFAGLSLLLAGIGVYGVVAFSVTRRTHEMGIRLALGAERGRIVVMVLRHGLWLALAGLAIGSAVALGATRLLSGLLYGVTARDPWTWAAAVATLATLALVAAWLPARRAARVDPIVALRQE